MLIYQEYRRDAAVLSPSPKPPTRTVDLHISLVDYFLRQHPRVSITSRIRADYTYMHAP